MTEHRVVLPVPEPVPAAPRLPVVALLAPAGVALGLWVITGQAMALLFAALGPVGALAAYGDQRWVRRRERRRSAARWEERVAACRQRIDEELAADRDRREARFPGVRALLAGRTIPTTRDGWPSLVLGRSAVPSDLVLSGGDDDLNDDLRALVAHARTVMAPVCAPPGARIGIVGHGALARAYWRSVALALLASCPVRETSAPGEEWLGAAAPVASRGGAHREPVTPLMVVEAAHPDGPVVAGGGVPPALVALVSERSALPRDCDVVIGISGGAARIERHPDDRMVGTLVMEPVSDAEATAWVRSRGVTGSDSASRLQGVELASLLSAAPQGPVRTNDDPSVLRTLASVPAVTADGPLTIDLVGDGPHALVAGTTGSGKSELLVSWMLALAAAHPPERLAILLVDFKGGAAFAPLGSLPHVVGTVTDLDADQAERALVSLQSEMRRRERALAAVGARAIEEMDLERLVVVIDEFAALIDMHPDLQTLLADLAARGRSLGIHLVLCTQRPSGVVRDSVLANVDLRICLRVNNEADSRAVVDTTAAARIDATAPGRAWVRGAGREPVLAQFAVAGPKDVRAVEQRWAGHDRPRRPWVEPLPSHLTVADLPGDAAEGRAFGVLDLPEEQRTATARWLARRDGSVLVLGTRGSGRTTALAALGARVIPSRPDLAWDALADLVEALDRGQGADWLSDGPTLVGIDDLDALVPRFALDHRVNVVEWIARLLREGPAHGLFLAVSAVRLTGETHPLAALLPSLLFLRHASRHDWVLSGGEGAEAHTSGPPGSGRWDGHRIQIIAATGSPVPEPEPRAWALDPGRPWAIVVGAPSDARRVSDRDAVSLDSVTPGGPLPRGSVVVGSVDEWSSRWGLLASLRECAQVVLAGCAPADVRTLTRTRVPPPPLPPGRSWGWVWAPDGELHRVHLPGPGDGSERPSRTMESVPPHALATLNR